MLTQNNTFPKRVLFNSIYSLVAIALFLSSCSNNTTTTHKTATPTATVKPTVGSAILKHEPSGEAFLTWDSNIQELKVKITLSGLIPKSTHPANIRAGNCSKEGSVIYPLDNLVADEHGTVNTTSTIKDVLGGIPIDGWYINVHNGPQLDPQDQFQTITCGNIANPGASALENQSVHLTLAEVPRPNQATAGIVQLTIVDKTLTVTITANGLAPQSSHAAQLSNGSCNNQGQLLNALKPIIADDNGNGTSVSTIPHMTTIPSTGWHITILLTEETSNQTGADVVACGDIVNGALG